MKNIRRKIMIFVCEEINFYQKKGGVLLIFVNIVVTRCVEKKAIF